MRYSSQVIWAFQAHTARGSRDNRSSLRGDRPHNNEEPRTIGRLNVTVDEGEKDGLVSRLEGSGIGPSEENDGCADNTGQVSHPQNFSVGDRRSNDEINQRARPLCNFASIDSNVSTRWERLMATLTIRDFDDDLKAALRVRAAEHGRSMESEVREILRAVLERPPSGPGMGTRIRQRFSGIGGADLDVPSRTESPRAADLDE